jgi:hypothetical protein
MKTKSISLIALSLGVCTLAIAADYNPPEVSLKHASPSRFERKQEEFNDQYKMEGALKTDRQIASEKEQTDREPSSIKNDKKKAMIDAEKINDEKFNPKPWLYKTGRDSAH